MKYQVSLEGKTHRQCSVQLLFEDVTELDEALKVARTLALKPTHALKEQNCPLEKGEALDSVCILFTDLAQAVEDGVPEDEIREVWPAQDRGLFKYITHRFS